MGKGIGETMRRKRVERATSLLRCSDAPAAEIAVAAGFCDQSHMIRAFRGLIGRTPSQVRAEWQALGRGEATSQPSPPLEPSVSCRLRP